MYLKKCEGPRTVILDGGEVLSLADLPQPGMRWVASRKACVVRAVTHGLIAREQALARYDLSEEEFDSWLAAVRKHGPKGLRVTAIQRHRQIGQQL
ncbi:CtrA inhibitor SciP [Paracoccus jiaweipingae]|uniref:CtrA inhibitor SciP n=1 Tax=unclassified Paracoccus (in: a-proteobacteria) TaxID=2688777 RepID=UPI00379B706D